MKLEPKILELLHRRGIETEEDIAEFLSDKPQRTHDPFLLHNMQAGVDLIMSAVRANRKICIYGDYDADGITSTVIMMEVLSHLTDNLMYYIPSRFEEGYGLNCDAVKKVHQQGAELLITVDCGCVSVEEVKYAKELGMDVLVTDHHQVTDQIAPCLVIDPNQPDDNYPCPYIAGCGVAFKVAQALVSVNGLPKSVLTSVLDVLGIGTIGDIVPLKDENRTFAKFGLRAINTSRRRNLRMLIEAIGLKRGHVTAEQVSFGIVPHLNAAGRMERATIAVEMFLEQNESKVEEKIQKLVECNRRRKSLQEATFQQCRDIVKEELADERFLLIQLPDAHEGITGIVAGKLKEEFYRPTVLFTPTGENSIKGTGRSIEGINLYQELKVNEELYQRFGGHAAACGLTLAKENFPELAHRLRQQMEKLAAENPKVFVKELNPDLTLTSKEINFDLLDQLEMLEPCGKDNEKPTIGVVGRPASVRTMGADNQYLRFTLMMNGGLQLPCVVFQNVEDVTKVVQQERKVMVMGALSLNEWNHNTKIQMVVTDGEISR